MRIRSIQILTALFSAAMTVWAPAGVVETDRDSGPGSLRQVIADAAQGEKVTFAPHLGGATIALTSGQLTIDKDLSLDASALAMPVTLDASQAPTPQRVVEVTAGVTAILDSLAITGGECPGPASVASGWGGGIYNAGALTLRNAAVFNNTTASGIPARKVGYPGGMGGGFMPP